MDGSYNNNQPRQSNYYNNRSYQSQGQYRPQHTYQKPQGNPFVSPSVSFLRSNHAERYRGAGILPIYVHQGTPYVLLGMDKRYKRGEFSGVYLNVLGGMRDDNDADCVTTAVREFWEESGKILDLNTRKILREALRADNVSQVLWYPRGHYALFLFPAQHAHSLTELPASFESKKTTANFRCEMTSLHWVSLTGIINDITANVQQNPAEISTTVDGLPEKATLYVMLADMLKQPSVHTYLEANIPHFTIPQQLKDAVANLNSTNNSSNSNVNNNNSSMNTNSNSNNSNTNTRHHHGHHVVPVCRFYSQGFCKSGDKCQFRHVYEDDDAAASASASSAPSSSSSASSSSPAFSRNNPLNGICKYFLLGHCKKGDRCTFIHAQPDATTTANGSTTTASAMNNNNINDNSNNNNNNVFGTSTTGGAPAPADAEVQKISFQFVEWFFNQIQLPNSTLHSAVTGETRLLMNNQVFTGQQAVLEKLSQFRGIQVHIQPNIQHKGDTNNVEIFVQGSMRDGEGRIVNFTEFFKLKKTLNLDGSSFFVIQEISMNWSQQ